MVTILTIGDPHFKTDNIEIVDLFIAQLVQLVTRVKPDLIVILGDILHYHERLHTIPLNKAYCLIEKMSELCLTYVLVGNHDMINHVQFLTTNHWMNALKKWENVVIVDDVKHLTLQNKQLTFAPFVPNKRFVEALNTSKHDWRKSDVIFAHQEFNGCKMGAIISKDSDDWKTTYPPVVSGHIHSRQFVYNNEAKSVPNYQQDYELINGLVYYTGSAFQHAFGESPNKMIGVIRLSSTPTLTEEKLNLPRKRIITVTKETISTVLDLPETKDKIRVNVKMSKAEFKTFKKTKSYKQMEKKGYKIEFKDTNPEMEIVEKDMNEHSFLKLLYQTVEQSENISELSDYYHVFNDKKMDYRPSQFRFYKKK